MALLSRDKKLFEVDVGFWGIDEPDHVPIQAAVRHKKPPTLEGAHSALAPLIPLTAVRLLNNSQEEPGITPQMMGMLRDAASTTLMSEEEARTFRFRGGYDYLADMADEQFASLGIVDPETSLLLTAGLPEVVPSLPKPADQSFHTELRRGPSGILWAKIEAPHRGPAFFAAFGLFAIIEWTAANAPYEQVVVPAMAGVEALCHGYFEVLERVGWESFEAMVAFQSLVAEVATAGDARAALREVREETD